MRHGLLPDESLGYNNNYMYIHIYVYVCIHTCTYIHTHTHIYIHIHDIGAECSSVYTETLIGKGSTDKILVSFT